MARAPVVAGLFEKPKKFLTSVGINVSLFHGEAPFVFAAVSLQTANKLYHRLGPDGLLNGGASSPKSVSRKRTSSARFRSWLVFCMFGHIFNYKSSFSCRINYILEGFYGFWDKIL